MSQTHPTVRLSRFKPTEATTGRIHAALKDPVRATLVGAAVLLILGSISGWIAVYLNYTGWFEISAFERASDGGITAEIGIAIFAVTWSQRAATSRLAVLILAPLVLGIVALLTLRIAATDAQLYLDSLKNQGGYGHLLPGFWATVGGATLATLAGAVRLWRARHEIRWTIGVQRGTAGTVVGAIAGAVLGFVGGVNVGELLTSGALGGVTGSVLIFFAIGFSLAGAWLGASAGGWLGGIQKS